MKIILMLFLVVSLYAETFKDYKIEVIQDMYDFQKAIRIYDKNNVVPPTIEKLMEYMAASTDTTQADLITLMYLSYKQNVMKKLVYEANRYKGQ